MGRINTLETIKFKSDRMYSEGSRFYGKGIKACAVRARREASELRKLLSQFRKEILIESKKTKKELKRNG